MTGNDGVRDELDTLATEAVDPAYAELDLMSTAEQVAAMAEQGVAAAEAVRRAQASIARAVDGIVARLRGGGRLVYIGAGTPGRLGVLDASEVPPTFGADPGLVVGIVAGGETALRRAAGRAGERRLHRGAGG
ncbi:MULTISPECIES: RpiR family transcriptional regulator [Microbacterium]|uniref:RpiR family transcriptional regulator n=1 Tax=Microbacterium TaxID=33882 RepID=UPI00217EACDA|nr:MULTISPECIES: RpiR family transcriptional regulator [Microbacterium]